LVGHTPPTSGAQHPSNPSKMTNSTNNNTIQSNDASK
jgi:hypothetical protein